MSLPPTKPIVPVFVTLAAITPTRNEPSQSLVTLETTFGAIGSGPTSTRPNFCCGKARRHRLHRLDHVERRADDDVEALSGGARKRRLELGDAARLDDDVVDPELLDRALHALVHHVVEGPVAHAGFGGDEGDLDLRLGAGSSAEDECHRE